MANADPKISHFSHSSAPEPNKPKKDQKKNETNLKIKTLGNANRESFTGHGKLYRSYRVKGCKLVIGLRTDDPSRS